MSEHKNTVNGFIEWYRPRWQRVGVWRMTRKLRRLSGDKLQLLGSLADFMQEGPRSKLKAAISKATGGAG